MECSDERERKNIGRNNTYILRYIGKDRVRVAILVISYEVTLGLFCWAIKIINASIHVAPLNIALLVTLRGRGVCYLMSGIQHIALSSVTLHKMRLQIYTKEQRHLRLRRTNQTEDNLP